MTSFSIQSFGCRVNQAEAFSWTDRLQRHGLSYVDEPEDSDLILVNTCTLTGRADRDVRSFIRRSVRNNVRVLLVVTGCYVERERRILEQNPRIWGIYDNSEKDKLVEDLIREFGSKDPVPQISYRSRALIKIQDGCSLGCSFCIIPSVRGSSRSIPRDEILRRVKEFVSDGYKEIVLTGVHLCLYGRDMKPKRSLLHLLQEIDGIAEDIRIRLSSLDPRFLDKDLLDYLTGNHRICRHFHLSLQHGSDSILRKMGRKITSDDYRRIAAFLRARRPEAAIGADIIVGYPGETDKDFTQMKNLLEELPLTYLHVFSYSPRPGTEAASMSPVTDRIVKERAAVLRRLSDRKNREFRERFLDDMVEGVVISRNSGGCRVLSDNYMDIRIPEGNAEERSRVRIRIRRVLSRITEGDLAA